MGFEQHHPARLRNRLCAQPLPLQLKPYCGLAPEHNGGERVFGLVAAAWVAVDLFVYQLLNGVLAVALNADGFAPTGRHHLFAHHQKPEGIALNKTFHNHAAALFGGFDKGGFNFCLSLQVDKHATAMVAVAGFYYHGQANVLCHCPSFCGRADLFPIGHRHATRLEERFGEVLVAGNTLRNGAGAIGFSGPNAALLTAIAQLHQVHVVQADERNLPVYGGFNDMACAGA